jgi:hypothetical protein
MQPGRDLVIGETVDQTGQNFAFAFGQRAVSLI